MNAVVTVIGKDRVGIIAQVSKLCAENNVSIVDITQNVLQGYFAMIMLVNIQNISISFDEFVDKMEKQGKECDLEIRVVHEDIFNIMHHV